MRSLASDHDCSVLGGDVLCIVSACWLYRSMHSKNLTLFTSTLGAQACLLLQAQLWMPPFSLLLFLPKSTRCLLFIYIFLLPHLAVLVLLVARSLDGSSLSCSKLLFLKVFFSCSFSQSYFHPQSSLPVNHHTQHTPLVTMKLVCSLYHGSQ